MMAKNDTAHDFEHVKRVYTNVEYICKTEKVDKKLVLTASLLHDIISFPKSDKRSKTASTKSAIEAKIVQDADRLDAIGAIGIARTFAVGGAENRSFYNKSDPFCLARKPNDQKWTVDHFYKKLLLLESKMNTKSAKIEAKRRTKIIKKFLSDLKKEI